MEKKCKNVKNHSSLETKVIQRNHKSFNAKDFRKAIMKLSALKKRTNISNN